MMANHPEVKTTNDYDRLFEKWQGDIEMIKSSFDDEELTELEVWLIYFDHDEDIVDSLNYLYDMLAWCAQTEK